MYVYDLMCLVTPIKPILGTEIAQIEVIPSNFG